MITSVFSVKLCKKGDNKNYAFAVAFDLIAVVEHIQ